METIFSQHGRGIEGDVFSGRNSRIAAGHILAHCGYGFRVHIGQYLTNQLLTVCRSILGAAAASGVSGQFI